MKNQIKLFSLERQTISWLSSKHGTSPILAGTFSLNTFVTGRIFADPNFDEFIGISGMVQDVIKTIVAVSVLFLADKTPFASKFGISNLTHNILVWLLAGIAVTVSQNFVGSLVSGEYSTFDHWQIMPIGVASVFCVLAGFTLVIAAFYDHKEASFLLATERKRLQTAQGNLKKALDKEKERFEKILFEVISPAISQISTKLNRLSDESKEQKDLLTSQIKSTIQDLLRPVSFEINLGKNLSFSDVSDVNQTSKDIRQLPLTERFVKKVTLGKAFIFEILALVLISIFLPAIFLTSGAQSAIIYGGLSTISTLMLSQFLRVALSKVRLPFLICLIISLPLNAIMVSPFYFLSRFGSLPSELVISLLFGLVLVTTLVSYFGLLVDRRAELVLEAQNLNENILNLIVTTRNELTLITKRIARLLHGTVQARLQAAAMKLSMASVMNSDLKESVAKDLDLAISALDFNEAPPEHNFKTELELLKEFWQNICTINGQVTEEIDLVLESYPIAKECLIEVCREAISNAIKHDKAIEILIEFSLQEKFIEVLVQHSGKLNNNFSDLNQSLGKKIFDDLTSSWDLSTKDDIICFKAQLVLA